MIATLCYIEYCRLYQSGSITLKNLVRWDWGGEAGRIGGHSGQRLLLLLRSLCRLWLHVDIDKVARHTIAEETVRSVLDSLLLLLLPSILRPFVSDAARFFDVAVFSIVRFQQQRTTTTTYDSSSILLVQGPQYVKVVSPIDSGVKSLHRKRCNLRKCSVCLKGVKGKLMSFAFWPLLWGITFINKLFTGYCTIFNK